MTLEKHRFELYGPTYTDCFPSKYVLQGMWLVESTDVGPRLLRANYKIKSEFSALGVEAPNPSTVQESGEITEVDNKIVHLQKY